MSYRVVSSRLQVVDKLDDPAGYRAYLAMLGQKHAWYEAEPRFLDHMGLMFLTAIQPILEKEVRKRNRELERERERERERNSSVARSGAGLPARIAMQHLNLFMSKKNLPTQNIRICQLATLD